MAAPHRLLVLDAETYYDSDYSLSKMAPPNYILDPRFEMIMLAADECNGSAPYIVDGPDVGKYLKDIDIKTCTCVTFNALFDMCIFSWRYGWVPGVMLDAMGMARALCGSWLPSASLRAVSQYLGAGDKGHEIENVKGMRRADIMASGRWNSFCQYAMQDVILTRKIFDKLLPMFPASERRIMDRVLRCAVQPQFECDVQMLSEHIKDVQLEKQNALAGIALMAGGAARADLMSTAKFAKLLERLGVTVETKISPTGNTIPALAKTDDFVASLQEHHDPVVRALIATRLGEKSTIEESRGLRLLSVARLDWSCYQPGNFIPIPLAYGRAHTHRLSGDWLMNMQNLPAGRGGKVSKLRKALIKRGKKILVGDLSQVEARINAWLCGDYNLLKAFRDNLDPYSLLASAIFGYRVNKKDHPIERFIGKSGELGLGFRCGAAKFYAMVVRAARNLGMDMDVLLKVWTESLAEKAVDAYRGTHKPICHTWYQLDYIIRTSWMGNGDPVKFGPCEIGKGYVLLPNGMKLNYANPRYDQEEQEYLYDYGKRTFKMHGGVMLENIVQALARIVVMHAALRLWDRGLKFAWQVHDELVFIVAPEYAEHFKSLLLEELRRPPSWGKNIPLDAEASYGDSYGDAK